MLILADANEGTKMAGERLEDGRGNNMTIGSARRGEGGIRMKLDVCKAGGSDVVFSSLSAKLKDQSKRPSCFDVALD